MNWIVENLWLIPALPLFAAGISALTKQKGRKLAASLAIGSMGISFLLALCAFAHVLALRSSGQATQQFFNFPWFQFGNDWLSLGWVLNPLTAVMLVMVTFVGLLIFIFSVGYMEHDENFTRFFCFLALFASAMLGVIISNSLLLLFMCWEIVGLTSYLLIGFWYFKPSAAAAAKKAFITTRIGDLPFFLGIVWLYSQTGTLLFYNNGAGALEPAAITHLLSQTTATGMCVATGIALLIFCGAIGKSGQFPLHVWLPDAMEGPTPVSALIHAATMVAAGVFLVARVYPLMSAHNGVAGVLTTSTALQAVTWIGAITALFGSLVAVAQFDIKRILAYSTVSQLGYMMMGLGVGGVAVGMFHLITHAFFKALLFLGAGSIIHGCSGEQDIRKMGGIRKLMPITFATYAIAMLALCGFPLFSGFWSKDEILHAAHHWNISQLPYYMGAFAALLTAFYMTRQVFYVFAGRSRLTQETTDASHTDPHAHAADHHHGSGAIHESPAVMTVPLALLSVFALLLGFFGTPAWPWFQSFLDDSPLAVNFGAFGEGGILPVMLISSLIVFLGLGLGWYFYGRRPIVSAEAPDAVGKLSPSIFTVLGHAFYFDALYAATFIRLNTLLSKISDWLDRWVWNGAVKTITSLVFGFAHLDNFLDTHVVNSGFDEGCEGVSLSGQVLSRLQAGRVQGYLKIVAGALIVFTILLLWKARA
ncbi:MAG TPA: NADH-quinone oxidoreductase subunit L [Acidobacteriaceae bacterium]|nr:NADH-quinone oxidoreductase subunit L [Acidobacteriaceae bacterium]